MKTHGPRMNRDRMRAVVDKLKIPFLISFGVSIEIARGAERWQIYARDGLVANSGSVYMRRLEPARGVWEGPFWNQTQLERALRAWRRGE